jgi:hypothetical protein
MMTTNGQVFVFTSLPILWPEEDVLQLYYPTVPSAPVTKIVFLERVFYSLFSKYTKQSATSVNAHFLSSIVVKATPEHLIVPSFLPQHA